MTSFDAFGALPHHINTRLSMTEFDRHSRIPALYRCGSSVLRVAEARALCGGADRHFVQLSCRTLGDTGIRKAKPSKLMDPSSHFALDTGAALARGRRGWPTVVEACDNKLRISI
jgi:hypothetical protein